MERDELIAGEPEHPQHAPEALRRQLNHKRVRGKEGKMDRWKGGRASERERERQRESVCVRVCIYMRVYVRFVLSQLH